MAAQDTCYRVAKSILKKDTDCEDSFGNRMNGSYPAVYEPPHAVKEADGSYSLIFEWETECVNYDTETLTILPCMYVLDQDGKTGPGSEHMIDWAAFTVPVTEAK